MRFGAILAARRVSGLRYIDYDALKGLIKEHASPRAFYAFLVTEIDAVDADFASALQQADDSLWSQSDMRRAAVLNYLAVLKISKKYVKLKKELGHESLKEEPLRTDRAPSHAHLPAAVEAELRASSFCVALKDPSVFARRSRTNDAVCPTLAPPTAPHDEARESCPVCLEPLGTDHARLTCQHAYCWACLASCTAHGFSKCPVCRVEQSLNPIDIEIETLLDTADAAKYSPDVILSHPDAPPAAQQTPRTLRIMTWNLCALTFPFQAPRWRVAAGIALGGLPRLCRFADVSLDPLHEASVGRLAQQAGYIRESGADVVLLQEVAGVSTAASLLSYLGDDFDMRYAHRSPSAYAVATWLAVTLLIGALHMVWLEPCLRVLLHPSWLSLTGGVGWRALLVTVGSAVRLRHSTPTQFLLGSIAGQLLVLCRKSSPVVGGRAAGEGFGLVGFEVFGEHSSVAKKSLLSAFFNLRPRGVQHVSLPVVDESGSRATLHVLNTHLPHASENDNLMAELGSQVDKIATGAAVVLGGDFNPQPDPALAEQFAPLLATGCVSTNGLPTDEASGCRAVGRPGDMGHELKTWDLAQPLTRLQEETPRSMQLDFLFFHQPQRAVPALEPKRDGSARGKLRSRRTPPTYGRKSRRCTPKLHDVAYDENHEESDEEAQESDGECEPRPRGSRMGALRHVFSAISTGAHKKGARRAMLNAACVRSRAAIRHQLLAPLPELEELNLLCATRRGRLHAAVRRTATAVAAPAALSCHHGNCQLEVKHTEIVNRESFFVPGAPLSDHYGLATDFILRVTPPNEQ